MSEPHIPKLNDLGQGASAHLIIAKQLYKHGRFAESLTEVDRSLQLNPELSEARYARGLLEYRCGNIPAALDSMCTATRLQVDYVDAWVAQAFLLSELLQPERALVAVDKAVRLDSDNGNVHLLRGNILMTLGAREEAVSAYRQAVRCNPTLTTARYKLATVLVQLGNESQAEDEVVKALRLDPMDVWSRILLGDLLIARDKPEEAAIEYLEAVRLNVPQSNMARGKLGAAWLQAGWLREAIAALKAALIVDFRNYANHINLARAYGLTGMFDEAREALSMAEKLDPSNQLASEAWDEIRKMRDDGRRHTSLDRSQI